MAEVVGPKVIELSEDAYCEIEAKLAEAGYTFLLWKEYGKQECIDLGEWILVRGQYQSRYVEMIAQMRGKVAV